MTSGRKLGVKIKLELGYILCVHCLFKLCVYFHSTFSAKIIFRQQLKTQILELTTVSVIIFHLFHYVALIAITILWIIEEFPRICSFLHNRKKHTIL